MSFSVAASIGNMPFASGAGANGPHIVYAPTSATWWVFWLSSTTTMNAAYWNGSAWTTASAGATFTLPSAHGSEGRIFSVVCQAISSHDVAWFSYGTSGTQATTLRATLGTTSVTWTTWSSSFNVGSGNENSTPHSTSIALDSSNFPYSLFDNFGDTHGIKATNADTGTAWTTGWGTDTNLNNGANSTASKQVIAGTGGFLLFLTGNEANASAPYDTNYLASYSSAVPTSTVTVFGTTSNTYPGDVCAVQADSTNYIIARRNATVLEARVGTVVSNAITSWTALATVPTTGLTLPATQSGVALISDGSSNVYLIVIDSGAGNNVKYCKFTKGASWSAGTWGAWTTLESSSQTRNSISSAPSINGGLGWVLWTETVSAGSQYSVVSGQLSTGAAPQTFFPELWLPLSATRVPPKIAPLPSVPAYATDSLADYTFPVLRGAPASGVSITATIGGVGSIAVAPLTVQLNNVALTGAGSVAVTPLTVQINSVALSGVGALTVAPLTVMLQSETLTGIGSISVAFLTVQLNTLALAGIGSISVTPLIIILNSLALTGVGTISVTPLTVQLVSLALAGEGSIAVSPLTVMLQSLALTGAGSLSGQPSSGFGGGLGGSGTVSGILTVMLNTVTLSGAGTISLNVLTIQLISPALAGVGAISVAPLTILLNTLALKGVGTISGTITTAVLVAATTLQGVGSLAVAPLTVLVVTGQLAGIGTISASPLIIMVLGAAVSGLGALSVVWNVVVAVFRPTGSTVLASGAVGITSALGGPSGSTGATEGPTGVTGTAGGPTGGTLANTGPTGITGFD